MPHRIMPTPMTMPEGGSGAVAAVSVDPSDATLGPRALSRRSTSSRIPKMAKSQTAWKMGTGTLRPTWPA